MGSKINRNGEKGINTFGSEMIIIEYRNARDIDVYFPRYNWISKNKAYDKFKNGNIKCPYERRYYGMGYLGEGKYKARENNKNTRVYSTWTSMIQRCYSEKYQGKHPTYRDCETSKEFHNFQDFGAWDENNYYTVEGQRMELDKDILVKHNKIYSPETCIYVPQRINTLFVKKDKNRGGNPIGVQYHKRDKIYEVWCNLINPETGKSKGKYLGRYDTQEKGFEVYKYYKEKNIKEVADYFKKEIPDKLYDALYNYEVEIDD